MNKYIKPEKPLSINDINFNSFQRKPLKTLNYAALGQQGCLCFKFKKMRNRLNHNFLSENFIYDPLKVFSNPMAAIKNKVLW